LARALLCVVALLIQTTVLPLAHAAHVGSGSRVSAVAQRAATAGPARVAAAHDTATCLLCATLAHGRAASVPVAGIALALHAALGAPLVTMAVVPDIATRAAHGPRAPPALSA
jgi:hypothetical protein